MLPPRKWLWSLGLLAAAPVAAIAGPFDALKGRPDATQSAASAPAAMNNQKVAQDIASALKQARLVGRDIDIEFLNGVAKIGGQIADETQRAMATKVVSSVPGVRSVENRLTLMPNSPRTLASSPVQQAAYEGPTRGPIQQVDFESVQADGSTPSQFPPAGPQAAAFPTGELPQGALPQGAFPAEALPPGAVPAQGIPTEMMQQFQGGIPAEGPYYSGAPIEQGFQTEAMGANQAVAQNIADAVTGTGLRDYDVEIRYKDGVCTLIGAVDNQQQAISANQAAAKVQGVQKVINRLTVQGRPVSVASQPQAQPFNPYPNAYAAQMAMSGQQPAPAQAAPQYQPQPQMQFASAQQAPQQPQTPIRPASAEMAGQQYAMAPTPAYPAGFGPGAYGQVGAPMGMGAPGCPPGAGPHQVYNRPNLPDYAWPATAPYDNYAAVSYPSQYDASAWPYIGPFYPYPQVPLGWRKAQLVWDDGYWNLKFDSKTDKWWWFLNPENWH